MAFSGLLALLDDIATIADDVATMATVAARKSATVANDVGTLTAAATRKTAGVVTDDMAVTAEQTMGIRREREIPVILAVARGSFRNKALLLAPAALLLNAVAPWSILPLLMLGGGYLCFEGAEKMLHRLRPHDDHPDTIAQPIDPVLYEQQRVAGAIRTDLVLSAEIIAISLAVIAAAPFVTQVVTLYGISIVMTVGVYGVVAGLVKLDDLGEALVLRGGTFAAGGRGILWVAPKLLHAISIVGTVAMLTVGGHIVREGIAPLHHAAEHLLAGIAPGWRGLAGALLDVGIGGVLGLGLVGIAATGIPARLWPRRR
jgi:hypothetical protein